ncbi:hypothetical protein ACHAWF_015791 [Thalassiosira exigua]
MKRKAPSGPGLGSGRRGLLLSATAAAVVAASGDAAFVLPQSLSDGGGIRRRWTGSTSALTSPPTSLGPGRRRRRRRGRDLFETSSAVEGGVGERVGSAPASSPSEHSSDLSSLRRLLSEASALHERNLASTPPLEQIRSRLSDLEEERSDPSFWEAPNAVRNVVVTREVAKYTKLRDGMEAWASLSEDAEGALEMLEEMLVDGDGSDVGDDEMIALAAEECRSSAQTLLELSQRYELETLLSGPYDASPCRLILTAGAGGTEACDWVSILYRMYSRYASSKGMTVTTLDESPGDVVGYKRVELLVEGEDPYGWLRGERGAHRLVRLSPFNANNKRQTTFAGVDVVPVLEDEVVSDVDIPDGELEVTTMRSGGKGGQNVNKVETGVRMKHLPSGISVRCTQERSQLMNKKLALRRLKAQLLAIAQEAKLKDINAIRGDMVEAGWGAQIRNYVLQPYKMIKDVRSGWETSDTEGVLDGGPALEHCVGAWLRWTREREEEEGEIQVME